MDSLYKNHPVGMVLLWQTEVSQNIPITKIDDTTQETSNYSELVIDGQQRLTSLYLAKHGTIFKGGKERRLKLLFNPVSEEFEIANPRIKNKPEWIDVYDLVRKGEYYFQDQLKKLGWPEDKVWGCMERLSEVKNILVGARNAVPVFSLASSLAYDEVADIFVNINLKGTKIRLTELLLALLALKIPGAFRSGLRQFLDELDGKGWELDVSLLIRSLVAVTAQQGRLTYFRGLARDISDEDLKVKWKITKKSIEDCLRLLDENLGIRTTDILPSQIVLVPLVYYVAHKQTPFTEKETREFTLWFLLASFWGRYAGSPETRLDEDIREIERSGSLSSLFPQLKKQVGRLLVDEDRFEGKSRNSKLLLYVVSRQSGAEDWWKAHRITTTDYEEHHIIPRSLLKKTGYELTVIDDVANIGFLTEKANKKISNAEPKKYLSEIDPNKLQKQFVPLDPNLWLLENYDDFLVHRRRLIAEKVNENLGTLGVAKHL